MTKEIVRALRCCAKGLGHDDACENCKVGEIQDRREYIEFAAANMIERLTAENAALREKVPQWISVEEKLPADYIKRYLIAFKDAGGSIVDAARYIPGLGWECRNWEVPQGLITDWMPLPGAPEKGDKA
jgi:hypothetical protein